jgi:hypothetical protein
MVTCLILSLLLLVVAFGFAIVLGGKKSPELNYPNGK